MVRDILSERFAHTVSRLGADLVREMPNARTICLFFGEQLAGFVVPFVALKQCRQRQDRALELDGMDEADRHLVDSDSQVLHEVVFMTMLKDTPVTDVFQWHGNWAKKATVAIKVSF